MEYSSSHTSKKASPCSCPPEQGDNNNDSHPAASAPKQRALTS